MASRVQSTSWGTRLAALASGAVVVAALYFGRELIVPVLVAALLGFVLMPSVSKLERLGIRRIFAVMLVSSGAFVAVAAVLFVIAVEIGTIASTIPAYEQNIRTKISALGIERALRSVDQFDIMSAPAALPDPGDKPAAPADTATPVRIVDSSGTRPLEMLSIAAHRTLAPLTFIGLAGIVLVFLLLSWEDVRERAIRLISFGRLTLTTQAMDQVARTISTVLRLQLIINTGFGLAAGLALWALGVPAAPLWGALVVLLRFVPYIGVLLAAAMPLVLAFAVSDGWSLPLMIAAVFLILELITGNIAEPAILGSRAGVSTLALLLSAAFWTWLWGLPGLFLSTPITVGLAVLGRNVPQLKVLDVLLGDTPVLSPPARFYQRLIAFDGDEAARMVSGFQDEHHLLALFERLLMPALRQLERDRHDGLIEDDRGAAAMELLEDLIELAIDREPRPAETASAASASAGTIVCLPARDEADALAAMMLAAAIAAGGRPARALSTSDLGGDLAAVIREAAAPVVCISAVPPFAARHAKLRRLQMHLRSPGVPVLTGLWIGDMPSDAPAVSEVEEKTTTPLPSRDQVITTLSQMLARLDEARTEAPSEAADR